MLNDYYYLGAFIKTHGLKGGLVLFLDVDDPSRYLSMKSLYIEKDNQAREYKVNSVGIQKNKATVILEGIDSIEKAEPLVKSFVYMPVKTLPEIADGGFYYHEVIGFRVTDTQGNELGTIQSILDYPGHLVYQVLKEGKEILLPANKHFVKTLLRENKQLILELPEGLIELYTTKKEK